MWSHTKKCTLDMLIVRGGGRFLTSFSQMPWYNQRRDFLGVGYWRSRVGGRVLRVGYWGLGVRFWRSGCGGRAFGRRGQVLGVGF